jgi:hypothetical protein
METPMADRELQQALLDRLRVNDTELLAVLADQLGAHADDVVAAARALEPEGVRLERDGEGADLRVVYAAAGAPRIASPGDDQPPA